MYSCLEKNPKALVGGSREPKICETEKQLLVMVKVPSSGNIIRSSIIL